MPFALFDLTTPKFIQGDQKFGQTVEARFADKYGIDIGDTRVISHSSYWRIGEEFGYDLIIRVQGEISTDYAPKGSNFSLLNTNKDNTPFRFSNLQFICKKLLETIYSPKIYIPFINSYIFVFNIERSSCAIIF